MADNVEIKTPSDVLTLGVGFVGIRKQQGKTHNFLNGALPVNNNNKL
jgi:hypothetical protein